MERKRIYLVGLGPGGREQMTQQAYAALADADVLCGYTGYVDLVRGWFPEKETYTTPMTQELARCRWALETAREGKSVAMLCSGDAGVYGMAGPLLQLTEGGEEVEITVVMHDFCVISLSDLLTPWDQIAKRLVCAAEGDSVIVLYNPGSKRRRGQLRRACEILLERKHPETVCGWVRNVGREGSEVRILSLQALKETEVDMFTTVFIGSSTTQRIGRWMVTPRGYENK